MHDPLEIPQDLFTRESYLSTSIASSDRTCIKPEPFSDHLAYSSLNKMSLLEEAKRVAAEFEFGADAVNKGVKEFIREMGWCNNHTV